MKRDIVHIVIITFIILVLPLSINAHSNSVTNSDSMPMMSDTEASQVSLEEFEEVENIMFKMMNNEELTNAEWQEMQGFIESHHGSFAPFGQMLSGGSDMMGMYGSPFTGSMMGGSYSILMMWIFSLSIFVWLLVGILLVVYLMKKLR